MDPYAGSIFMYIFSDHRRTRYIGSFRLHQSVEAGRKILTSAPCCDNASLRWISTRWRCRRRSGVGTPRIHCQTSTGQWAMVTTDLMLGTFRHLSRHHILSCFIEHNVIRGFRTHTDILRMTSIGCVVRYTRTHQATRLSQRHGVPYECMQVFYPY